MWPSALDWVNGPDSLFLSGNVLMEISRNCNSKSDKV